jgi:putative ABC transport system permease protein
MAIAVSAVIILVGISTGFQEAILAMFEKASVDIIVLRKGVAQRVASNLNESLRSELEAIPGVASVEPMLVNIVAFEDSGLPAVQIFACPPGAALTRGFRFRSGRPVRDDDARTIVLGHLLADLLQRKVGDTIEVEGEPVEVVGIYESASLMEDNSGMMSLRELQSLMGQVGRVTSFLITVTPGPDRRATVGEVARYRNPAGRAVARFILKAMTKEEHVNTAIEIQLVHSLVWATSGVALVLGAIGVLNTMMMSVAARTRDIGVMRAVGWRPWRVTVLILVEAAVLCLFGAVAGTLLGIGGTWLLGVLPFTKAIISQVVYPSVIVRAATLAFVAGLVGAAYPAYIASRLLPSAAPTRMTALRGTESVRRRWLHAIANGSLSVRAAGSRSMDTAVRRGHRRA